MGGRFIAWIAQLLSLIGPMGLIALVLIALIATKAGAADKCPYGQMLIEAYYGPHLVGSICLSAAEVERWKTTTVVVRK